MRRLTSILIMLCGVALIQGCGTGSFLGQRYDNFTAYYNTFYNAERVFDQGYEGVGQADERIDRTEFLPVFVRPQSGSRGSEFESAIEKSADVLRDHPDSKWVDDALMLIGKSYFYRENFVGAIQKFREVVSLGTGRQAEGRFWLARTLIISGAFDEAESELRAALAGEDLDRRWAARYHLALGELNVIEEDWEAASVELAAGLEDVKDDELAARAWFTLGQVYEKLERYDEAADAYRTVRKNSPPYELSYAAAFSATRVEGFHGNLDEALSSVRKLERDDKNLEYQSEIRLLRAQILQRRGRDDEAFAIYSDLLYNPNRDLTMSGLRGRVHYSLGELYRDIDGDYVLAAAHFDTARTSMSSGSRRQAAGTEGRSGRSRAPEAIEDLDLLVESYSAYAEAFKQVARFDSLLHLGSLSQDEFDERVLELRQLRAEELERQRKLIEEMERNQQFNRRPGDDAFRNSGNQGLPAGKTIPDLDELRSQNQSGDAGFLGVEDAIRVQEGRVSFVSRWGERPLVPNWRRQAAISNVDVADIPSQLAEGEPGAGEEESDELPEIDISAVPRDSTARLGMRRDRALARYELGNTLFLGMNRPDSAAVWYRMVLDEGDSTDVSQRALYALAEVQYSLGDSTSATRLYRDILERYPKSDFSDNVRDRLGVERDRTPSDSISVALAEYGAAFARWDSSGSTLASRAAFNEMLRIAALWPETEAGAQSLLSATEIHLEMAGADSAAIFGVLPVTVDDRVLEAIWPKKVEELRKQARQDSLMSAGGSAPAGRESEDRPADVESAADPARDADADGADADSVHVDPAMVDSLVPEPAAFDSTLNASAADSVVVSDTTFTPALNSAADSLAAALDPITAGSDTAVRPIAGSGNETPVGQEIEPLQQSAAVSPFAHVALSDSLVIAVMPPGISGSTLGAVPDIEFVHVEDGGAFARTQALSALAASLRVQDLLEAVGRLHPRTPFATRAQQISSLLDELLVVEVPVDTLAADSLSADSLSSDSLVVSPASANVVADSTGLAAARDSALVDSTGNLPTPTESAARRLSTREDSLAAAELSGKRRFVPDEPAVAAPPVDSSAAAVDDSSTVRPGERREERRLFIDEERREERRAPGDSSAAAAALAQEDLPALDVPEGLDVDPAELEKEGIRSSSSFRPLTEEGPDASALGWTVVFQSSRDIPTAQLERRRFKTILADRGDPLQLLIHTKSEEPEVLVAWGLFDTRAELQIALETARRDVGDVFPEHLYMMVLLP